MSGVFQINRDIFSNNIWTNVTEFRTFFYILGNAVWKEEGIKIGNIHVKRGQYLRSYRNLREDLMYIENNKIKYYGVSTIKRTVDKLVKDGRIRIEETELGTLFTVANYSLYQRFVGIKGSDLEHTRNTVGTAMEQVTGNTDETPCTQGNDNNTEERENSTGNTNETPKNQERWNNKNNKNNNIYIYIYILWST